jgi:N6-L-threonylcarbamoyladenine synthase
MIYILGIESTCDETAAAIIDENKNIIGHSLISQIDDHVKYGGVVPEIASRKHLENIAPVFNNLFNNLFDKNKNKNISINDIDFIGCASKPGLIGGLLVGKNFSKAIASVINKPFIEINHLEAHLLMPFMFYNDIKFPNIALLISGGHCQIFLIKDLKNFEKIGFTIDDSVGETFDKVARMLDMPYPGGPNIENYAKLSKNHNRFIFPKPLIGSKFNSESTNLYNLSFSGLKTSVKNLINNLKKDNNIIDDEAKSDICYCFQKTVSEILIFKLSACLKKFDDINEIIISGGVASNKFIRSEIENFFYNRNIYYPPIKFCTDNGVMIAFNTLLKIKNLNY